jgi:hypothetical protein
MAIFLSNTVHMYVSLGVPPSASLPQGTDPSAAGVLQGTGAGVLQGPTGAGVLHGAGARPSPPPP